MNNSRTRKVPWCTFHLGVPHVMVEGKVPPYGKATINSSIDSLSHSFNKYILAAHRALLCLELKREKCSCFLELNCRESNNQTIHCWKFNYLNEKNMIFRKLIYPRGVIAGSCVWACHWDHPVETNSNRQALRYQQPLSTPVSFLTVCVGSWFLHFLILIKTLLRSNLLHSGTVPSSA